MTDPVATAQRVLWDQADALRAAASRIDRGLELALEIILQHPGKVVVAGVGKSGAVSRKIAATLSSTGTPAIFMHPVDALHGDLGVCAPGDPAILLSKSGTTTEMVALAEALLDLGCPIIALVGNPSSKLAVMASAVLDASVRQESDSLNLAPTTSTTVALALGDALAVALMGVRRFSNSDFARFHPAGQLGRGLTTVVRHAMHGLDGVATVQFDTPLMDVVILMTQHPLGAACVLGPDGALAGLVTDGDVRRVLAQDGSISGLCAVDVMTEHPVTTTPDASLIEAAELMESGERRLSLLPVVASAADQSLVGLIRIHDVYRSEEST